MYDFYLNYTLHSIKNRWEELSPSEFVYLFDLLELYKAGELSVGELRSRMVLRLMGITTVQIKDIKQEERFAENIFHIQSHLDFIFRIEYDDKRFSSLSPALRQRLARQEPDAGSVLPEERLAARFKRHYEIDSVFCSNLLPEINGVPGYQIGNQSGVFSTNLTTTQFCDAITISDQFIQTGDKPLLNLLTAILYCSYPYKPTSIHQHTALFCSVPDKMKEAVFFNFQSVLMFIYTKTKYRVLWGRSENKKTSPYNSGLAGSILAMAKKYGGLREVGHSGLIDFLEMMLDSLTDYIRELAAMDKTPIEIANKTKLDVLTINELL